MGENPAVGTRRCVWGSDPAAEPGAGEDSRAGLTWAGLAAALGTMGYTHEPLSVSPWDGTSPASWLPTAPWEPQARRAQGNDSVTPSSVTAPAIGTGRTQDLVDGGWCRAGRAAAGAHAHAALSSAHGQELYRESTAYFTAGTTPEGMTPAQDEPEPHRPAHPNPHPRNTFENRC